VIEFKGAIRDSPFMVCSGTEDEDVTQLKMAIRNSFSSNVSAKPLENVADDVLSDDEFELEFWENGIKESGSYFVKDEGLTDDSFKLKLEYD